MQRRIMGGAVCAVLVLTVTCLATGCGRQATPPPAAVVLLGVAPGSGPTAGGAVLSITGSGFVPGILVEVGGNPAANVVVLNPNTITCTTPAGPPGAQAAVLISDGLTTDLLLGAYFYIPPPNILQVVPGVSSSLGGMQHTLNGSGFQNNTAGLNTVTVGGVPATNVNVVSDTVLQFTAPAVPAGIQPIEVTNANGVGLFGLSCFVPILAAQGSANFAPWSLYAIEPLSGDAYLIGPLPIGITGMDFSPAGVLYGVTAGGAGTRDLVTIDPATAAVSLVGPIPGFQVTGICFVGSQLFGSAVLTSESWIEIDPLTGAVITATPSVVPFEPGGGTAADATSTNVFWLGWDFGFLWSVDVLTPTITPLVPLSGGPNLYGIGGATFHQGALFGVVAVGSVSPSQVFTIDTTTGVLTPVGLPLPPRVSALASPTR